jgi:hypothetical protein
MKASGMDVAAIPRSLLRTLHDLQQRGRMRISAGGSECLPFHEPVHLVEFKQLDRAFTNNADRTDGYSVGGQLEMPRPKVNARIEEPHQLPSSGERSNV